MKSKIIWWNGKVIRRPKSESVLDRISGGYFIDFVSLWDPFWNPDGASFGVTGPRLPIWRQFWRLKIHAFWRLERTKGLRGFFVEFKASKWYFVALSPHVYTLFSKYKVAFVNMNDLIHLYKTWVLYAQNAYISASGTAPAQDPDRSWATICM